MIRRMSAEEEAAAIGRLVVERKEAQRQCDLLREKLEQSSRSLRDAGRAIAFLAKGVQVEESWYVVLGGLPTKERLILLCEEYEEAKTQMEELHERAARLGI
jgi:hypothetical protein